MPGRRSGPVGAVVFLQVQRIGGAVVVQQAGAGRAAGKHGVEPHSHRGQAGGSCRVRVLQRKRLAHSRARIRRHQIGGQA